MYIYIYKNIGTSTKLENNPKKRKTFFDILKKVRELEDPPAKKKVDILCNINNDIYILYFLCSSYIVNCRQIKKKY